MEFKGFNELDVNAQVNKTYVDNVDRELRFTEMYRSNSDKHPYIREALCLAMQIEEQFLSIEPGDWFAGRINRAYVGIDPERGSLQDCAWYCQFDHLANQLGHAGERLKKEILELIGYWKNEATYFRCREAYPQGIRDALPSDDYYNGAEISYPAYGMGGPCLDFSKLVQLGLPGLRKEAEERLADCSLGEDSRAFLEGCLIALDAVAKVAIVYAKQAEGLGDDRSAQVAASLRWVALNKPETFHQAIQLLWLYCLAALPKNYGRLDITLGGYLKRDIDEGRLSLSIAQEMLDGLWRLIVARTNNYNNRVIIGGRGRPDESAADMFAMLAIQATINVHDTIPQLSLRWYEGMDRRLWDMAFEAIGKGCTFPIIYNDDVNIPAIEKLYHVGTGDAEQYVMYGCGEYLLDHRGIASPDGMFNVAKALSVTVNNGIDPFDGQRRGLALGNLEDYENFDAFKYAFLHQLDAQITAMAKAHGIIYDVTGKFAAYPLISLLYDDCIERAKPLLAGGVRIRGGITETFGNTTAGDSLYAIKSAVFDRKLITAERLRKAVNANFIGYERERAILRSIVKFGNDNDGADGMCVWLNESIMRMTIASAEGTTLDNFLVVQINNGDSILLGKVTAATPDGRVATDPLSNGNQPSAGNDISGITALLNSMAKLDPSLHAGVVHNLKVSRQMLERHPGLLSGAVKTYFEKGGTQLMITSISASDMQDAVICPEKYGNLIVRVGGYSARFVELPKDIQRELIKRTLY